MMTPVGFGEEGQLDVHLTAPPAWPATVLGCYRTATPGMLPVRRPIPAIAPLCSLGARASGVRRRKMVLLPGQVGCTILRRLSDQALLSAATKPVPGEPRPVMLS